jgi:hypothetical protein
MYVYWAPGTETSVLGSFTFEMVTTLLSGFEAVDFFATVESGRTRKSLLTQPIEPYWKRTLYQSPDFARTATFPPVTFVTAPEVEDGELRTTTFFPVIIPRPRGAGPFEAVTLDRLNREGCDLDDFFDELDDAVRVVFFLEFRADFADPLLDL